MSEPIKFLLVDAETGEQVRELPNAPSVLMLKELLRHCSRLNAAQQEYFECKRTEGIGQQVLLDNLLKMQNELREYMGKVSRFLPQLEEYKPQKAA